MINAEFQKYMPTVCPHCGFILTFDGIHLMCNNVKCQGRVAKLLSAQTGMLDLKRIGGRTIEPFAQDFSNIYEVMVWALTKGNTKEIEKYGIKQDSRSHQIFLDAFKNIRSLKYSQVIQMMGYDGIGRKLSELASREYCGLVADYKSMEKALVLKLKEPEIISTIKDAVTVLESLGVVVDKPKDKVINTTTMNNSIYVCMTGSPSPISKTKEVFISQFPNATEVSITDKNCQYLITDSLDAITSKMTAAKKKGILILTYSDFKAKFSSI